MTGSQRASRPQTMCLRHLQYQKQSTWPGSNTPVLCLGAWGGFFVLTDRDPLLWNINSFIASVFFNQKLSKLTSFDYIITTSHSPVSVGLAQQNCRKMQSLLPSPALPPSLPISS